MVLRDGGSVDPGEMALVLVDNGEPCLQEAEGDDADDDEWSGEEK